MEYESSTREQLQCYLSTKLVMMTFISLLEVISMELVGVNVDAELICDSQFDVTEWERVKERE